MRSRDLSSASRISAPAFLGERRLMNELVACDSKVTVRIKWLPCNQPAARCPGPQRSAHLSCQEGEPNVGWISLPSSFLLQF